MRLRPTPLSLMFFALAVLFCSRAGALDLADVLRLHEAGLEEKTILSVIESSGDVFELEADDLIRLKEAGISERVLRVLVETKQASNAGSHKAEVQEDGSILLTNRGVPEDDDRDEPDPTNVIPSRSRLPMPEPIPAYVPVVLPEAAAFPARTAVRDAQDRGRYGIGYRWHPSWDDHSFAMPSLGYQQSGWPLGAQVSAGWNTIGGYYFLPAAVGPDGPSSFGQFGFHLLPQASVVSSPRSVTVHTGRGHATHRRRHRP